MTRTSPGVSVIVSTYNQARYLSGLLASLQAQDCDVSHEVIVCDDGSSDETYACVQAHGRTTACDIRYVWQPDLGFRLGRSRNNGMRCARGEVLVFVDANSVLRPFFLRDHCEAHQGADSLVYGGRQFFTLRDGDVPRSDADLLTAAAEGPSDLEGHREWLQTVRPWMACIGANLSVRKARCLPYDEAFEGWGSEDRDFAYRHWEAGDKVEVLQRTGLVQLLGDESEHANPLSGHKAIVAALKGKLHLARKYPGDLMAPSLDLVRQCHLDQATNTWRIGAPRDEVPVSALLDEFATWLAAAGETEG